MDFIKEVVITKKVFNTDEIKIGDKVLAKRLLSCKILPDGTKIDKCYDISDVAIVSDLYNYDYDYDEYGIPIIQLDFSFGTLDIDIKDVLDGEWEISKL